MIGQKDSFQNSSPFHGNDELLQSRLLKHGFHLRLDDAGLRSTVDRFAFKPLLAAHVEEPSKSQDRSSAMPGRAWLVSPRRKRGNEGGT
ncbi:hypothetical protein NKI20_18930 [Mesorhizobium sp. M0830]|uniref:hypothetical protein n=1 Tax=unclassified Mesorhizobium TaxID=325217 RepID=UPI003338F965